MVGFTLLRMPISDLEVKACALLWAQACFKQSLKSLGLIVTKNHADLNLWPKVKYLCILLAIPWARKVSFGKALVTFKSNLA